MSCSAVAESFPAKDVVDTCGGIRLVVSLSDDSPATILEPMAAVLEQRLEIWPDPMTNVSVWGGDLHIDLPLGLGDPTQNLDGLLRQGVLRAHLVEEVFGDDTPKLAADNATVWDAPEQLGLTYWSLGPSLFDSTDVAASEVVEQQGRFAIQLTLQEDAATSFEDITTENVGTHMVLVLDDEVLVAALILASIPGGKLMVSGGMTKAEAMAKSRLLNSGTLPYPLYVSSLENIAPGDPTRCTQLFSN